MSIADMKTRGTILTPSFIADGSGGSTCNWTERDTVWCQLEFKGDYHQVSLRKNSLIQKGCRINIGGVIFEILQITDDGNMQVLKCRKV